MADELAQRGTTVMGLVGPEAGFPLQSDMNNVYARVRSWISESHEPSSLEAAPGRWRGRCIDSG